MVVQESKFHEVVDFLSKKPLLSFDTETNGLHPYNGAELFAVVVSDEKEDYYFDFNEGGLDRALIKEFEKLFVGEHCIRFAHNAKFDLHFLSKESVEIGDCKIHDTEVIARVLYNQHTSYSLAHCAERIGLEKLGSELDEWLEKNNCFEEVKDVLGEVTRRPCYEKVPFDLMYRYAIRDSRITFELGKHQLDELTDELAPAIAIEYGATKALFNMERVGVKTDTEYARNGYEYESVRVAGFKQRLDDLFGGEFTDHAGHIEPYFTALGFKVGRTKDGNPSAAAWVLESIPHETAKLILDYRDAMKRKNTYWANILRFADSEGVIHPNFRQAGAQTLRTSCSAPNMQNQSKEDDSELPLRKAFVPRDGFIFVELDFAAQEFRLAVDYAGEGQLAEKINSGLDVHQSTADLTGLLRKQAKCVAKGTLILTDNGLKPIEEITLRDRVWDGIEYVAHSGVISNGVKEVIEYEKTLLTKDHIVFTQKFGPVPAWYAATQQEDGRAVHTGAGENPIRYINDSSKNLYTWGSQQDPSFLFRVWEYLYTLRGQCFGQKNKKLQMPEERSVSWYPKRFSEKIQQKILGLVYEMLQSKLEIFQKLWWAWHQSEMYFQRVLSALIGLVPIRNFAEQKVGRRPNKQYGSLRGWQSSFSYKITESLEQKKEVYDIVNCGPRSRFTANGILVHNCLSFAIIYGAGAPKIAGMLKCSTDEAKIFKAKYFHKLPGIKRFIYRASDAAKLRKSVKNWAGVRYHFPDINWAYKAANSIIQGGCAYISKNAMRKIDEFLRDKKSRMVLQVHDSILLEMPEDELHLIPEIQNLMISAYPHKIMPMGASVEHSRTNWGELIKGLPDAGSGVQT